MITPWYKQFWPWFLISLPLTVIIGTLVTVALFARNSVHLVAEDYYKKGKGINIDIRRQSMANDLNLSASLSSQNNAIVIHFSKGKLDALPALKATFTHRTLPDRDFTQMLTADASGNYRLFPEAPLKGPWFIELEPFDSSWLLQGRISFPIAQPIALEN
ncbi:hypothetical protein HGP28_06600 [Vibrio sp. SM6]|uniref:Nitrogen fixation protein FixH n=1 Tax=Vibrio agarilyticus TaxID=2726741 RepID=A0A7X8TQ30_9VIBR|nr:FixH family protein [Vibrio agarilyticus]NLS12571.1 hypothetical protein [Vibrio agarilyticus]